MYTPNTAESETGRERNGGEVALPSNSGPLQIPPYVPGYAAFDLLLQYRDARRDFLHSARNRKPIWSPPHSGSSMRSTPSKVVRPQSARPFRPNEGIYKSVHFKSLEKLNKAKSVGCEISFPIVPSLDTYHAPFGLAPAFRAILRNKDAAALALGFVPHMARPLQKYINNPRMQRKLAYFERERKLASIKIQARWRERQFQRMRERNLKRKNAAVIIHRFWGSLRVQIRGRVRRRQRWARSEEGILAIQER